MGYSNKMEGNDFFVPNRNFRKHIRLFQLETATQGMLNRMVELVNNNHYLVELWTIPVIP